MISAVRRVQTNNGVFLAWGLVAWLWFIHRKTKGKRFVCDNNFNLVPLYVFQYKLLPGEKSTFTYNTVSPNVCDGSLYINVSMWL